jgi:hypothetical protein
MSATNGTDSIAPMLKALQRQTLEDWELVIGAACEDDSNPSGNHSQTEDSCLKQDTELVRAESRIKIIKTGSGNSAYGNLNLALKAAHGRYVKIIKVDEILVSDALQTIADAASHDFPEIISYETKAECPARVHDFPAKIEERLDKINEKLFKSLDSQGERSLSSFVFKSAALPLQFDLNFLFLTEKIFLTTQLLNKPTRVKLAATLSDSWVETSTGKEAESKELKQLDLVCLLGEIRLLSNLGAPEVLSGDFANNSAKICREIENELIQNSACIKNIVLSDDSDSELAAMSVASLRSAGAKFLAASLSNMIDCYYIDRAVDPMLLKLKELREQRDEAQLELERVEKSHVWKFTEPLRKLARRVDQQD